MKPSDYLIIKSCVSINHPKGNITKLIDEHDDSFKGFGEAYLTNINRKETKGWKKHHRMHSVLYVIRGVVEFKFKIELTDDEEYSVTLSDYNPQKLYVKPGIWMAFTGKHLDTSTIINLADIAHDPTESITVDYEI